MTVLIIPSWYKTESNAVLGSFFREQAMVLQKAGINVIMADATLQGKKDYFSKRCFSLKKYNDEGLLTYSYVVPAIGTGRMQNGGSYIFYLNLKKIYKKIIQDGYKIDVIHAHSYMPAGVAAIRLGKEEGIPVVITEHASDVLNKQLTPKRKSLLKEVVSGSKEFICVSDALKKAVSELTDNVKEPVVIPNLVDSRFVYNPEKQTDKFTYISIGNLIPSKRFDLTIEAFALCFRGNSDVKLKILGDGILRKNLEILAHEKGIKDQIVFKGRVSRERVVRELQDSNVFVLPSDYETFGMVYVEALSCGLPVIGTKNGGAEEIITKNNGYLIKKDNPSMLATAMREAYETYYKFDKSEIARDCKEKFGENQIIDQILKIYYS